MSNRLVVVAARTETPIAFVQAVMLAYKQRGLSPDHALAAAQIPAALVHEPGAKITSLQLEWLSECAMRELDDEALGWFGRSLPLGSYSLLAHASISAPSLGDALARWCRHHNLLADDIRLELNRQPGGAVIELHERRDLGRMREFCTVAMLRNVLGLACWLIDSRIHVHEVDMRHPAPLHADCYRVLFDGRIRFNSAFAKIIFDAGYLNLPVRRDDTALQRMLQRPWLLTVKPYGRDRLFVERVRQLLSSRPELGRHADDLAGALHMSSRTLHRQLRADGASLQALKNSVRLQQATALLSRTQRPAKAIAAQIGLGSERSFRRAFRDWAGKSPEEFRDESALHVRLERGRGDCRGRPKPGGGPG